MSTTFLSKSPLVSTDTRQRVTLRFSDIEVEGSGGRTQLNRTAHEAQSAGALTGPLFGVSAGASFSLFAASVDSNHSNIMPLTAGLLSVMIKQACPNY